ncbi:DUF6701 domain-containing protein [Noviherbaspirillum sp.]|uniref:DUF6701 domain-containing protein n=1 Tax=Noviherbaspirillum sp. TaxID=1926288 RepID=UPI002B47ECB2|nr:DUF6701 domain-containing protein [Noviherbaspirillum sp.]HJV83169.1 DUF6701 domain-containing protein [Noviherbaspirillum sp.]
MRLLIGIKRLYQVWQGKMRKPFAAQLAAAVCAVLVSLPAQAANCTSTGIRTNWSDPLSWTNCNGTPGSGDSVTILNGHTINANVTVTVGAVTIDSGGTLNISSSNWTSNGIVSISGTLAHTNTGGSAFFVGRVNVNSGGTWNNSVSESINFRGGITNNGTWINGAGTSTQTFETNSQIIDGASPITFDTVAISGAITVTNNNSDVVTINGRLNGNVTGSTWVNGSGSTLNYVSSGSNRAPMETGTLVASASGNTVIYGRANNQTIEVPSGSTYYNLTLAGTGTKNLPPGLTIAGDFTATTSGTLSTTATGALTIGGNVSLNTGVTFNAGSFTHSVVGNFVNNGASFSASSSTFIFNGSGTQTISSTNTLTFNNLTVANTGGTVSPSGTNVRVTGVLNVNAGAVLAAEPTAVINNAGAAGTLTGSGTVKVTRTAATADFASQYKFATNSLTNLTVDYAGTAAQIVSALTYGGLTVSDASGASMVGTTTVSGLLTVTSGALNVGGNTLILDGPSVVGNNLSATAASSLVFGGSSSDVIIPASVTTLRNLTVNNANGITLSSNLSVGNILTLTSGAITTNAFTLTSTSSCAASISRPANGGYVNGSLTLTFPSTAATCTFPVGSGTAYAPITVSKPLTFGGGTLTGSTTGSEHPQIAGSSIDATKDVNRYWSLTGDTINSSNYGVTVTFVPGDVDTSASTGSFVLGRYDGTSWSLPTPVDTRSAATTGSSVVAGPLNNASFAAGETAFVCSVPSGLPSTMTCVCDNFGRSRLNPSTIYGGNWSLSTTSGTFGVPQIVNSGYLRLTDNSTNVSTAATMPGTFPAAGNLITVEFKHFAYVGSGPDGPAGADGVALTLSDSAVSPQPGAFGGSLGYAQKTGINGFTGGWVGVGIDEYGNYSTAQEGRVGGGNSLIPDSIAVRGSGSGTTGYPFMAGTSSLNPGVDDPTAPSPVQPGKAYRITVDARCYERNTSSGDITCNNPSLAKRAQVTVNRDTTGAGNFTSGNQLISFDAYTINPGQANVPANWKLSFTGSTGSQVNIHEIQGLKICAQTITPPAGYRIQVDNVTPSICGGPGQTPSSPIVTITALDTNGNVVTTYNKTINLKASLSGGGASNATWRKVGTAFNITQYTFTPTDNGVAQFYLTDTSAQNVYLTIEENGGTISSSFGSAVQFSGAASFDIENVDTLATLPGGAPAPGGGVVAGRPHRFMVKRTNAGCGVDTSYSGAKNLDGWYSPASGDHPTGANAPQLCAANAGTTCFPIGSCQTLSIAEPTIDSTSNFMPALNFSNGAAYFCLATSDVGKYSLSLRDDTVSPVVRGASGTLTARPFAVTVSGVTGERDNPGDSSAQGSVFTSAGTLFQATVSALLWNAGSDANGDGLPDAVSLSQLASGGVASHYADLVTLGTSTPFYPATAADSPPGSGVAGTLYGNTVSVSSGSTVATGLNYSEVGTFSLSATASSAYLNTAGVDLNLRTAIYSTPADTSQRNALVGRFKPARFVLTGSSMVNRSDVGSGAGCSPASTFTYLGEPMRVNFSLMAVNASGATTQNYAGNYARFSNSAASWTNAGANDSLGLWMAATNQPVAPGTCRVRFDQASPWNTIFDNCTSGVVTPPSIDGTGSARVSVNASPAPAMTWNLGVGTFAADAVLGRVTNPDGPYDELRIGIAPQDGDGVKLLATALNTDMDGAVGNDHALLGTPTQLRFGRLRLANAFGSDRLNLPITMRTESWNGTAFTTNTLDSCTALGRSNMLLKAYDGSINSTNMPLTNINVGSFTAGIGTLNLTRPAGGTGGVKGSVTLCVDLAGPDNNPDPNLQCQAGITAGMPWLQGRWGTATTYTIDPFMRATFGVYRGGPVIYFREMY